MEDSKPECVGAIYSSTKIITSANCVTNGQGEIDLTGGKFSEIVVGTKKLSEKTDANTVTLERIKGVRLALGFNRLTNRVRLAVVILNEENALTLDGSTKLAAIEIGTP